MNRPNRPIEITFIALWVAIAAALFAGLMSLGGCASSETSAVQQVTTGRELYTTTLAGLNSAHRLGYLDLDQKRQLDPYVKSARAALDEMERQALAGGTTSIFSEFTAAAETFRAALDELLKAQLRAEQVGAAVKRAATRPAAEAEPIGG